MSSLPGRSPTQKRGFHPLSSQNSLPDMNENDIPLETVRTNSSASGARKEGSAVNFGNQATFSRDGEKEGLFHRPAGRRKLTNDNLKRRRVGTDGEEDSVTAMGVIYNKMLNSSVVTRYLLYVVPIGILLAIPIVLLATVFEDDKNAVIGGVRLLWFFTWLETIWLGLWASKVVAKILPRVFMFLCGVVSSGTRKYATLIGNLEIPISLLVWAIVSLVTFTVLAVKAPGDDSQREHWVNIMQNILGPAVISAAVYLGEKTFIQLISISYHARSFDNRIKESKRAIRLLGVLYDASRALFPMYCPEFEEEDILINDSIEAMLASVSHKTHKVHKATHKRSGSATPMRILGDVARMGDKITSAFGNVAQEISGKQVFNPNSAHSIVIEALEKTKSSEALAKRLWMSFVVEGMDALRIEDFQEVLGSAHHETADEAFVMLDQDLNGDVSLDEMIMKVVDIGRDRKAIANSMHDVGQAIGVLDQVLCALVFVGVVFVFIAFLNASFVTTLATAGTTLLSMSFVFAVTAQEFLGSCIFLFVKHPYDVGDRVDIVGPASENLVVQQISLLYTVFQRIDNMKMVQVPNIVLNNLWIENVTRSKAMKEQLDMFISFDTTLEDVELLRREMQTFVRNADNSRDFQPDIVLECTGIGNMDKLQLKVEIRHKSNWHNETVRAARRSKFMCALVLALRKVPIYGPGGGGLALGDPGNPSYSVAVSDQVAAKSRDKAAATKEAKRLVPSVSVSPPQANESGKSTGVDVIHLGTISENLAAESINARKPTDDAGRDDGSLRDEVDPLVLDSSDHNRNKDIENLRDGLLKRQSTRGKRRAGETLPLMPAGDVVSGFSITMPEPQEDDTLDEEASVGTTLDSRMYSGSGYGREDASSYSQTNVALSGTSAGHSIFPTGGRSNALGLTQLQSAPATSQAGVTRGRSIGGNAAAARRE
ncbi:MAG: hypothetical protein M1818_005181 [Claussenomyces sp. TS43310]|nr:MAG: hypothetical protein M1818_005181 [Claussenomyces sp. TS43310]